MTRWIWIVVISCLLAGTVTAEQTYVFDTIALPWPDAVDVRLVGINDRGDMAGFYQTPDGLYTSFTRWANGRFRRLSKGPLDSVIVRDINQRRDLVGSRTVVFGCDADACQSRQEAVWWDRGIHGLGFQGPDAFGTELMGVNGRKQAVGYFFGHDGLYHGFRVGLDFADFQFISVPGASMTIPRAINTVGHIVGSSNVGVIGAFDSGFLYAYGQYVTIDAPFPGAYNTVLEAINDRGMYAGWFGVNGQARGLVFDGQDSVEVLVPGALETVISGMNNEGHIVGHYFSSDGLTRGFVAIPSPDERVGSH
jgi:hypothetical protein